MRLVTNDEWHPPMATQCRRSERYDCIHFKTMSEKPKSSCTGDKRQWWSNVSNAVLMSRDSSADGSLLSTADRRSLTTLAVAVSVGLVGLEKWTHARIWFGLFPWTVQLTPSENDLPKLLRRTDSVLSPSTDYSELLTNIDGRHLEFLHFSHCRTTR